MSTKMKLNKWLSSCINITKHNFITMLQFEIVFHLITYIFLFPAFKWMINFSGKIIGLSYLTQYNASKLLNPLSILVWIVLLLLVSYLVIFEINAVFINYKDRTIRLKMRELIVASAKQSLWIFKPKNMWAVVIVLILLPLDNGIYITSISSYIKIPSFVLEGVVSNPLYNSIYTLVLILLGVCMTYLVFVFIEMLHGSSSFGQACAKSISLVRHRFFKTILVTIGVTIVVSFLVGAVEFAVLGIVALILKNTAPGFAYTLFVFFYSFVSGGFNFISFFISFILGIAIVTYLYEKYSAIPYTSYARQKTKGARIGLACLSIVEVLTLFGSVSLAEHIIKGVPEIYAHRCGGELAPENSLSALKNAIEIKADGVETDVQQTKDGVLIISHDSNFNRLSHVNKNVWDVTFDEVETYDNGAFFSEEYRGEKYATLEQFLQTAQGKIHMIIELKSTGHDDDHLVTETLRLVDKYDMKDQVFVASMNAELIQKAKELDPTIKTQLISAVAEGNFDNMNYADCLSVETTFASLGLVNGIHDLGKTLFVWTVNDEQNMSTLAQRDVDALVTDNPILAREVTHLDTDNSFIDSIAKVFFGENNDTDLELFKNE